MVCVPAGPARALPGGAGVAALPVLPALLEELTAHLRLAQREAGLRQARQGQGGGMDGLRRIRRAGHEQHIHLALGAETNLHGKMPQPRRVQPQHRAGPAGLVQRRDRGGKGRGAGGDTAGAGGRRSPASRRRCCSNRWRAQWPRWRLCRPGRRGGCVLSFPLLTEMPAETSGICAARAVSTCAVLEAAGGGAVLVEGR